MEIKTFEFDLERKEDDTIFSVPVMKRNELKLFDAIKEETSTFTEDFEALKGTLQEDEDRASILSMLIYRGWQAILEQSPLFNEKDEPERIRNELYGPSL